MSELLNDVAVSSISISLSNLIAQLRKQEELQLEPVPYNPELLDTLKVDKPKTMSWLNSIPGDFFGVPSKAEIESWKKVKSLSWLNDSVDGTNLAPPEGYVENNGKSTVSYMGNQLPVSEWETRFTITDSNGKDNKMYWANLYGNNIGSLSLDSDESKDQLTIEKVEKLSPKKGDILLVRVEKHVDGTYDRLRSYLDDIGFKDVTLMIGSSDLDISVMDEEEMRQHGWVKKTEMGRQWL